MSTGCSRRFSSSSARIVSLWSVRRSGRDGSSRRSRRAMSVGSSSVSCDIREMTIVVAALDVRVIRCITILAAMMRRSSCASGLSARAEQFAK